MRRPIEKLCEAAMAQRSEYVRFKQRRKDVKAKQELLKSKITDDTSHYYQRFAYLYKKAKLASREEGHLAQAHKALDELEKQMDEILAAEDPREALQTKDAEVTRDLSDLKQMVETWIAAYEQYQAVVKETVTAVGKATATGDGDFSQITDLRKAGKAIGKPLEKYLKRYDKVKPPTKWFKDGKAPTLVDAERVFLRAHNELDQLMRRARQVIANPGGNKVRCRRRLPKAHQEWIATAQRFVQAVREMAQEVQASAADDPEAGVRAAGPKVYNRLAGVADGFDPLGFTDAVKALTEPTSSDAKRKAAREAGMRLVRRLHDEIYRAPLLVTITDKANPFTRIFTQTSDLLVALKRMEIEILTAV